MGKNNKNNNHSFEQQLFHMADKLRKNIDAAEYKHVVLGLIFLRYISDAFKELYDKLVAGKGEYEGANPEDKDEYQAENVFYVPPNARWEFLQARAKNPSIGEDLDTAMDLIEKDNPVLKGILPKVYARPNLDKQALGGLIDLISNILLKDEGTKSKDLLGRVYEYFLGEFANAEGKKGGQFYTPKSIVRLMVEMIEPFKGRVYDPCCGSGGMFVMSDKFIQEHRGKIVAGHKVKRSDISIYGQESNQTTYRLCRMNLAIRGIDGSQVKWNTEGSFLNDLHKDLKADFILANPPFNDSDWSGQLIKDDSRWKYGVPPAGNANFAWIQQYIYHLAPNGIAATVMHCGAATNRGVEYEIRKRIIEGDVVDCIVYTPTQLFYNTTLPVHLWFINRNKSDYKQFRDRKGEVLMIDASDFGSMRDSTHRDLSEEDIKTISDIYHQWKTKDGKYKDIVGLCKNVTLEDIRKKDYVIAPNRFIRKQKTVDKDSVRQNLSMNLHDLSKNSKIILDQISKLGFLNTRFSGKYVNLVTTQNYNYKKWKKVEVSSVIKEVISGEWGHSDKKMGHEECKVIRGTDFPNIPLFNLNKIPTRYIKTEKVTEKRLEADDLVIEISGGSKNQPTGRAVFITAEFLSRYTIPVLFTNFCKTIRVNQDIIDPYYFYLYWSSAYFDGLTNRYENQPSGIKNFQFEEFISAELIYLPPKDMQKLIVDMLQPIFEMSDFCGSMAATLRKIEKESYKSIYYGNGNE